jgi:hypothetical protein
VKKGNTGESVVALEGRKEGRKGGMKEEREMKAGK